MNEESKLKAISSAAMEEVRKSYNEDSALSSPGKDGGHPSHDSSPASDQKDIVSKSKIPAKRPKKKRSSKSSSSSERSEKSASVEKSDRRRNYRRPSYSPEKDSRDETGRSVKSKKAVRKSRVAHSSSHSRSPSCSRSKSCSPSRSSSKGRSPTPKAQRSAGKGSRTPPRKRSLSPGKKKSRPGRNRLASTSKSPSPGRSKAKKMSVPDNDVDKKPTERVNANGSAAEKVVVEAPTTAKPRNAIEEKLLSISNSKLSPSRSRSKTKSPFRRRSRSRSPLSKRRSKSPKRRRESPVRRRRDSRSPPKKRNRTPPSRKRSSRSPIRRKSSPRRRSRSRTRSRSASRSPVNRRRSPTPDRKRVSRSPVRRRRSASPIKNRRSRSPLKNRRSRSPSKNRRSRSPSKNRRSRSPSKNRRSRSPSKNRRSRSPSKNQRSRSPSKNRRSRSPSKSRRSPTPDKTRRSRSKDRVGKGVEASSKPASKRNPYWGNRGIKRYRDSRSPSPEARYDTDAGFTRAVLPQQLKDATSSTRGSAAANKKERIVTTEEIEQRLAKHQKNLQDKAAEEARKINLPGYLNPAMVNVHQFKQVQEKRKLLWSKAKEKTDASQWAGAFDGDDSTDDKFRRLMGIHGDVKAAAASSTSQVLKSRQVLEDLEKEYEKSRAFQLSRGAGGLTGIGLGFGSAAPPGP